MKSMRDHKQATTVCHDKLANEAGNNTTDYCDYIYIEKRAKRHSRVQTNPWTKNKNLG